MKAFGVLFVLFMLLLAPALLSLGVREVPLKPQGSLINRHKIYGGIVARQEFVAPKNGLTALAVTIRNFNLMNKKDMTLSVFADNQVIRRVSVNGANIPDGALLKFRFDPIFDSSGKRYIFTLASEDSSAQEAFEMYFGEDNKTIAFSDYYKSANKLVLVGDIYKSFLSKFFADRVFAIFYLLLIGGSLAFIKVKKFT